MAAAHRLLVVEYQAERYAAAIARRCPGLAIEARRPDAPDLAEALAPADILLGWTFPAEAARGATRLRWIQSIGAGVDHLLAIPDLPADVAITRVGHGFAAAMAEHVLGVLLALSLDLPRALEQQRARRWRPYPTRLLRNRTALVVGLGAIGGEVARGLRSAGLYVLGVSRSGAASDAADEVWAADALDCLLARAEIVVLVVPLTDATRGLLDARRLALLPRGAWLVNVARGAVADEAAVVAALQAGELGGAALDVFAREPLPPDSPLWTLPNVLITPHVSGPDDVGIVTDIFAQNYERFRRGEALLYPVERSRGY